MAIKLKTGKLKLNSPLEDFVASALVAQSLRLHPITLPHIYFTRQLPLHHKDPFDRLLIAQSLTENLPVISSDPVWDAYGVQRIWG